MCVLKEKLTAEITLILVKFELLFEGMTSVTQVRNNISPLNSD